MGILSDGQNVRDALQGLLAGNDGADRSRISDLHVKTVTALSSTAAATAANPMVEVPIYAPQVVTQPDGSAASSAFKIVGATITSAGAITADNTNYATFAVNTYTSAGATKTVAASLATTTTGSGTFAAFQTIAMSLTAANVIVPAGGCITVEVTKAASGVVVTAGACFTVFLEPV